MRATGIPSWIARMTQVTASSSDAKEQTADEIASGVG